LANFNGKEHLRHRAVSLRQHGFLVLHISAVLRDHIHVKPDLRVWFRNISVHPVTRHAYCLISWCYRH